MLKEYLNYIQTIKEIKPAAYPQSIQETINVKKLPKILVDYLLKGIKKSHHLRNELYVNGKFISCKNKVDLLTFHNNEKEELFSYLDTNKEKKYFNKIVDKFQLFFIASDDSGESYSYSFKDDYVYVRSHETRQFEKQYDAIEWVMLAKKNKI